MARSSKTRFAAAVLSAAAALHCKSERRDVEPRAAVVEATNAAPAATGIGQVGATSPSVPTLTTASNRGEASSATPLPSATAGTGRAAWDMPLVSSATPLDFDGVARAVEAHELLRVWRRAQREGDTDRYLAQYHADATVTLPTATKSALIREVARTRLELLSYKSEAALGMQIMAPLGGERSGISVDTELCMSGVSAEQRCHRLLFELEPNALGRLLVKREAHRSDYPFTQRATHVPQLKLTSELQQMVLVRGPCDPNPERRFKLLHPEECERRATMLVLSAEGAQYYIDLAAPGRSRVSDVLDEFATPDAHGLIWQTPEAEFRIRKDAKRITVERRNIDPEAVEPGAKFVPAAAVNLTADSPVPFYCVLYAEQSLRQCLPELTRL